MNIRPLIIDAKTRELIRLVLEKASSAPVSQERAKDQCTNFADTTLDLPFGYRVTFTVDLQPNAACRHLSISVNEPGKLPGPAAIELLMKEFGFINQLSQCACWTETFDPGHQAVNLLEPISGNMNEIRRKKAQAQRATWPPPGAA